MGWQQSLSCPWVQPCRKSTLFSIISTYLRFATDPLPFFLMTMYPTCAYVTKTDVCLLRHKEIFKNPCIPFIHPLVDLLSGVETDEGQNRVYDAFKGFHQINRTSV